MSDSPPGDVVLIGRIAGLFGLEGWVKVYSYTRPREAILKYDSWRLKPTGETERSWREFTLAAGRLQGPGVVARFEGITNREAASQLVGADIAIARARLPKLRRSEYYWADLEGLRVLNLEGVELGIVNHLFDIAGANDVMVVVGERERLIPFTKQAIHEVDLERGIIRVDWDADF